MKPMFLVMAQNQAWVVASALRIPRFVADSESGRLFIRFCRFYLAQETENLRWITGMPVIAPKIRNGAAPDGHCT